MGTIVVTDEDTRDDLALTLGLVNADADAKKLSRAGYIGTRKAEYERWHSILNELLEDWERAEA